MVLCFKNNTRSKNNNDAYINIWNTRLYVNRERLFMK